jgi:hypothetical protein
MNERIRELARQSGGIDMTNHVAGGITTWIGTGTPEFLEKFAELIIHESIEVMKKQDYHGEWLGEKIKEHFGVKE